MTTLSQRSLSVSQLDFERQRSRDAPGEKAVDVKRWFAGQNILRPDEYVVEIDRRNDPERDFTIYPAKCQIVDLIAKGRDIGALRRIELYHQDVIAITAKVTGQLK